MGTRPFGGIDVSFRLVHCPLRGEFYPRHGCFVVGVSYAFLVEAWVCRAFSSR